MKSKIFIAITLAFSCTALIGQEELSVKNKQGLEVLPQAGEWAFGIDASPFLNYFGRMLNGSTSNPAPSFQYPNASSILNNQLSLGSGSAFIGKRMLSSSKAQRVRLMLSLFNENFSQCVAQDNLMASQLDPVFVEDTWSRRTASVMLGYGIEHRKGNKRLQGIYGYEGFLGYFSSVRNYSYGNEMNFQYTQPTTHNFDGNSFTQGGRYYRSLSANDGSTIFLGARAFIGAEYFILPKLSIGGEFGYSAAATFNTNGKRVLETFDFENLSAETVQWDQKRNSGSNSFGVGLDNFNFGLNLILYL